MIKHASSLLVLFLDTLLKTTQKQSCGWELKITSLKLSLKESSSERDCTVRIIIF